MGEVAKHGLLPGMALAWESKRRTAGGMGKCRGLQRFNLRGEGNEISQPKCSNKMENRVEDSMAWARERQARKEERPVGLGPKRERKKQRMGPCGKQEG